MLREWRPHCMDLILPPVYRLLFTISKTAAHMCQLPSVWKPRNQQLKGKLTIVIKIIKNVLTLFDFRIHEEVTVDWFGHCSQTVTGLQGVVAVVDVCRVLEGQAALQVVLVEVHLGADVVILQDLLVIVEPAQFRVGVAANRELDAGVMALLGFSQPQDHWRNCREGRRGVVQWWVSGSNIG